MDPDARETDIPGPTATRSDPVRGSGVLNDAQSLWQELLGLTHDHFRLAALETQRAGESLVAMIVAGVMLAILLSGAWLGLMVAVVLWLVEHGLAASSGLLLAVAVNVLVVLIPYAVILRKRRYLRFPATLRSLQPLPPSRRDAEKA